MAKNLFIFNSKKFPWASFWVVILIMILETGSWITFRVVHDRCLGGDLLILGEDFFCRDLHQFAEYEEVDEKYHQKKYRSWKDIREKGPYDTIVFGSSVGRTGWVEMLEEDYNRRIINMIYFREGDGQLPQEFSNIMRNYKKINENHSSIWLHVDITERIGRDFREWRYAEAVEDKKEKLVLYSKRNKSGFPFSRLIYYFREKRAGKQVAVIGSAGSEQIFPLFDLKAVGMNLSYSVNDIKKLAQLLEIYKSEVARKGGVLAVAIFPTKPQQYEWVFRQVTKSSFKAPRINKVVLMQALTLNDIPYVDLEEELDSFAKYHLLKEGKWLWNRADSHMNNLGTKYTANIIDGFLEEVSETSGIF